MCFISKPQKWAHYFFKWASINNVFTLILFRCFLRCNAQKKCCSVGVSPHAELEQDNNSAWSAVHDGLLWRDCTVYAWLSETIIFALLFDVPLEPLGFQFPLLGSMYLLLPKPVIGNVFNSWLRRAHECMNHETINIIPLTLFLGIYKELNVCDHLLYHFNAKRRWQKETYMQFACIKSCMQCYWISEVLIRVLVQLYQIYSNYL